MEKEIIPDIIFKGIKGEVLSLNKGYLVLTTKAGTLVICLSAITGFYCEKAKENYKIRLYSSLFSSTIRDKKDAIPVIILNNTDKERFVTAIKSFLLID